MYISGKVGFESSRTILYHRIKLDLTNVNKTKEFQQNCHAREVVCGRKFVGKYSLLFCFTVWVCVQNLDVVLSTILLVSNLNDSYSSFSFSSRRLSYSLVLNTTGFVSVLPFSLFVISFVNESYLQLFLFVNYMNVLYKRCKLVYGESTIIVIPFTFSNSIQSNRLYEKHNNDVNIYLEDTHTV